MVYHHSHIIKVYIYISTFRYHDDWFLIVPTFSVTFPLRGRLVRLVYDSVPGPWNFLTGLIVPTSSPSFATLSLIRLRFGLYLRHRSNKEAARLFKVNVIKQFSCIYVISGLFAGLAGIRSMQRLILIILPGTGNGMELDVLTPVSNGTSLAGHQYLGPLLGSSLCQSQDWFAIHRLTTTLPIIHY